MATKQNIQIAYQGVFNIVPHPHIHLVALGTNSWGESLYDIDSDRAEQHWVAITKQAAVIMPITHDRERVYRYIADKNSPAGLSEMIIPHNLELLKKIKEKINE